MSNSENPADLPEESHEDLSDELFEYGQRLQSPSITIDVAAGMILGYGFETISNEFDLNDVLENEYENAEAIYSNAKIEKESDEIICEKRTNFETCKREKGLAEELIAKLLDDVIKATNGEGRCLRIDKLETQRKKNYYITKASLIEWAKDLNLPPFPSEDRKHKTVSDETSSISNARSLHVSAISRALEKFREIEGDGERAKDLNPPTNEPDKSERDLASEDTNNVYKAIYLLVSAISRTKSNFHKIGGDPNHTAITEAILHSFGYCSICQKYCSLKKHEDSRKYTELHSESTFTKSFQKAANAARSPLPIKDELSQTSRANRMYLIAFLIEGLKKFREERNIQANDDALTINLKTAKEIAQYLINEARDEAILKIDTLTNLLNKAPPLSPLPSSRTPSKK
jgi:hypothetical protein